MGRYTAAASAHTDHEPLGHAPRGEFIENNFGVDWRLARLEAGLLKCGNELIPNPISGPILFDFRGIGKHRGIYLNYLDAAERAALDWRHGLLWSGGLWLCCFWRGCGACILLLSESRGAKKHDKDDESKRSHSCSCLERFASKFTRISVVGSRLSGSIYPTRL